jgi:hypothetical protein
MHNKYTPSNVIDNPAYNETDDTTFYDKPI